MSPTLYVYGAIGIAFVGSLGFGAWQTIQLERCRTASADVRADTAEGRASALTTALSIAGEAARLAAEIGQTFRDQARAETRTIAVETDQRAERVRTIIREVPVPVGCPVRLPVEVEDEGRAAVARANKVE